MADPITPENRDAFLAFVAKALDTENAEIMVSENRPTIPHPETGCPLPGPETTTTISLRFTTKHNTLTESK